MGQSGCKTIIESKVETAKEADMDEDLHYNLLTLDGIVWHEIAACEERSRCQAMMVLKIWFSGNEFQQNTIDSILDELCVLKLDENTTSHEFMTQFLRLISSLKTSQDEMLLQTVRDLFLNNIANLDYENIRKC